MSGQRLGVNGLEADPKAFSRRQKVGRDLMLILLLGFPLATFPLFDFPKQHTSLAILT